MIKIISTPGLSYRKLDLHIHTPASYDYQNNKVTADEIVAKSIKMGLDAIAITDHNSGSFIEKIKQSAHKKIIVFPGVEISSAGGKDGSIHIIALLDPSKGEHEITMLLGALQIQPASKPQDLYSKKSPSEVIDIITQHGGIAICAHANSSNGILNDWRGNPRTDVIQNPHLLAVEATDFEDVPKEGEKKRVCDFLDGTDPNYKRKLAVYRSSDSHDIESIGSRYSLFKLEEVSIDGLRQCFYDPDVRIRQQFEEIYENYPKITKLSVNQGFLKDQTIFFHQGLNCLVGGKGVGKSLIIELIRFALDQCSEEESILDDHNGKVKNRLGHSGEVSLEFEIENGQKYSIVRQYDGSSNPLICVNLSTGMQYAGKIPRIFSVLAYSQNEIIKTAEDELAQLQLIDNFHNPSIFYSRIQSIRDSLSKIDREFAETVYAVSELGESTIELRTLEEELRLTSLSLENKIFLEMETLEGKEIEFQKNLSYLDNLTDFIDIALLNLKKDYQEPPSIAKFVKDKSIIKAQEISKRSRSHLEQILKSELKSIEEDKQELQVLMDAWLPELKTKRAEYEKMLAETGGDKKELEAKRRTLVRQVATKRTEVNTLGQKVENNSVHAKNRNDLLNNLDATYDEFYKIRKQIFDKLTYGSNGRLKLEITKSTNSKKFSEKLISLLKGQRIQRPVVDKIAQSLTPRKFVDYVINSDSTNLAHEANITPQNAEKIISHLQALDNFEDLLAICYLAYPEDTPSIQYKKDDGIYYPLNELSVGQKCTALLIIALSDGDRPIIIDQPEDSLDNPSVYEDIVSKLRIGKENRQFILTTHNSSVGVASDSDNFIIIEGTATSCVVKHCGAIDKKDVRLDVINHLEGGDEPYHLKSLKYSLN
jgi:PHP family Zn ribbon phosphoesterase